MGLYLLIESIVMRLNGLCQANPSARRRLVECCLGWLMSLTKCAQIVVFTIINDF